MMFHGARQLIKYYQTQRLDGDVHRQRKYQQRVPVGACYVHGMCQVRNFRRSPVIGASPDPLLKIRDIGLNEHHAAPWPYTTAHIPYAIPHYKSHHYAVQRITFRLTN